MIEARKVILNFENKVRKVYKDFKLRKQQVECIEKAIDAFESGYKTVLIDMPTGGGKSIMNYVIATHFADAYYTTPQIVLLDQLAEDKYINAAGGIAVLKGREHYPCIFLSQKTIDGNTAMFNARNAPCNVTRFSCMYRDECPYYIARENALNSRICALSFAFLINTYKHPDFSVERELLIVDEGDDIENWIADFSEMRFMTPEHFSNIYEVFNWAKFQLRKVDREINYIEEIENLTPKLIKRLHNLREKRRKLELLLESKPKDYTFHKKGNILTVKAVNVQGILKRVVWNRGEHILVTSGTIINPDIFSKYTGLEELGDYYYIEVEHPFPVDNRPIIVVPCGKMTKEKRKETYSKMVNEIVEIVAKHKGENGIIHAHSYEIANEIVNRLRAMGINVLYHNKDNRNEKFKEFIEKGGIFVSVGFERGIDLKYDLCRFQIITKVPYPNITDIRVKEIWIKRKDWIWARYQAIKNLAQMYGRAVRAKDDYAVTYILDDSIMNILRYKSEVPSYLKRAVQYKISENVFF